MKTTIEDNNSHVKFETPSWNGRYFNNPSSFTTWKDPIEFHPRALRNFIRWRFLEPNKSRIPDTKVLDETLPVQKPKFSLSSSLSATWLGHASVFVRIDGISIITDPVWTMNAAPYGRFFCPRYRQPPCSINELPKIDVGLISHNHYDHLDVQTIRAISSANPKMAWMVPKGLRSIIEQNGGPNVTIYELSWGENAAIRNEAGNEFKIWSIPAQHWSARNVFDKNKSLWCGWLVEGPRNKFYYTGDTGFCRDEFAKVGSRFGPVNLSAIPIGCYSPKWFMSPQHVGPEEAIQIHQLVKSQKSIAIHWGTYKMGSTEAYLEPKEKLVELVSRSGIIGNAFCTLNHGETWEIED